MPANQQLDTTYMLAAKEWNDAQQKVVKSFQQSQGTSVESWLYLAVTLVAVSLLLALYFYFRHKRR
ncbi:MAG TPA: hypothetical protein DEF34_07150 [Desulfotomaculum sp.]|nr:MAG: hypothetical protein JL56_04465 [Desulfotomaculum sp. BICA1-6]HBX23388.1 hypothetical protein [Desulfotomaculum sp.]